MTIAASAAIHPTALIEDGASIGENVTIGAFCVVGPHVQLANDVRLDSHVAVSGRTKIGARTRIFPFASIGSEPQDLKFKGEISSLEVGEDNQIREHVTMNPGTEGGGSLTRVGDRCLFMVGTHVAHDCMIGSNVIMANNSALAGHVEVGDFAVLGGLSAVHQFVRIGAHAMVGGMTGVERDVIPAGAVMGNRAHLAGLNLTGLKRRGIAKDDIHSLRSAYRDVFEGTEGELIERAEALQSTLPEAGPARDMITFILARSSRRFCMPAAV
jgi:UDP-N-acetylglucosamine acyltransferase